MALGERNMTSIDFSSEPPVWFDRLTAALSDEAVECFARRMSLDEDAGDTFFKPLTEFDQWGACQLFPESPEEFARRWTSMSGPCSDALSAELVQAVQEILEQALGAREFDGEIPLFTYTL